MTLNERELGTVLAALRLWWHWRVHGDRPLRYELDVMTDMIANGEGQFEALSANEIEKLCTKLEQGE